MNKTKIEWCDYSWNPIKGICPVGCWYCYARAIYKRFKLAPTPSLAPEKEIFSPMNSWKRRTKKARIFTCSTFDIFHPVADQWRDLIFQVIAMDRHDTFIILTKMPERIDRPMPPNVWLGVSLPGDLSNEYERWNCFKKAEAIVKFISFEPLMRNFDLDELFDEHVPDWIIIGAMKEHGKGYHPPLQAIESILDFASSEDIPVFLKNNLAGIWPGPLIQEFPR